MKGPFYKGNVERKYMDDYCVQVLADGIVFTQINPNIELDLEAAKRFTDARTEFREGVAYPTLSDIRFAKPIAKEVRDHFAQEGFELTTANAFLVNNVMMKVIAEFFNTLRRPPVPSKVFSDGDKAVEWLKEFL